MRADLISIVRCAEVSKGKEEISREELTSGLPLRTPRAQTMWNASQDCPIVGQEVGVLTANYHFLLVEDPSWLFHHLAVLGSHSEG